MATRRERVVLDLEDRFTEPMARAAAMTSVLDKNLNHLGGTSRSSSRDIDKTTDSTERLGASTRDSGKDIDSFSGRLGLLGEAAFTLGPAIIPLATASIPALTASIAGLGAGAAGLGVAVLALHGLGDGIKALDAANLDPTVENLQKLHDVEAQLGPAGTEFLKFIDGLEPQLKSLQFAARDGFFPGLEDGINSLLTRLPDVKQVVTSVAEEMGRLSADAGKALSSDEFTPFFDYIKSDAAPTLDALARSAGNVALGLSNLLVGFAPASRDFTASLEDMTKRFADWSTTLDTNQGFQDLLSYVRQEGPQAAQLLGSLVNLLVAVGRSAAPVGNALIPALTGIARVLTVIGNSPAGPALYTTVAALIALNRAIKVGQSAMNGFSAAMGRFQSPIGRFAVGATAAVTAFDLLGSAVDTYNASTMRAIPGTEQLTQDILSLGSASAANKLASDIGNIGTALDKLNATGAQGFSNTISSFIGGHDALKGAFDAVQLSQGSFFSATGAGTNNDIKQLDQYKASIDAVDQALANIATTGSADQARQAFDNLAAAQGLSKSQQAELLKLLPNYKEALAGAANSADLAAGATGGLAGAQSNAAAAARAQAQAVEATIKAMQDQRQAALGAFDAVTQYRQAMVDANKQARKSNDGIQGSSQAALANRGALSQLAAAWNNQSAAVQNNNAKFQAARANFIQTAQAMGVPRQQAINLAKAILNIPQSRAIQIQANATNAFSAINGVKADLANLHDRTVFINVHTRNTGGSTIKTSVDTDPTVPTYLMETSA